VQHRESKALPGDIIRYQRIPQHVDGGKLRMLVRKGLPFVKGHMGGDEILLLHGDTIPAGREIEIALQALHSPSVNGHEAGFLIKAKPTTV